MKKLFFSLLFFIGVFSSVFSQEKTAFGVVNNLRTKAPVQNALVKVAKTDRQVYTDSLGNFTIEVSKGSHHLMVSHINFVTYDRYLKAPYWNKPLIIGLRDSIWVANDAAKNKVRILTSQYEFNKCYRKKGEKTYVDKEYTVLFVLTKKGDTIEFNKKYPGRIIDTGVFGYPQIRLPFGAIDSTVFNKTSLESIWKNGINYKFIAQDSTSYLCYLPEKINVPLEEIELLKISEKNNNSVGAVIIVTGATAGVVGIALIINAIINFDSGLHF